MVCALSRTAPAWRTEVQCSGRRWFTDGVLAHVRTPGGPTGPAQSLLRLTRSSPTPRLRPSLTQSNRRGTDPYARWWGRGGIARCPPIPIYGAQRALVWSPILHDWQFQPKLDGARNRNEPAARYGSSPDSPLEGTGFEPSVPLLRKALLGVANRRRRRSHLQVQARDDNACLEWLPIAFPFAEGPRVRIRLPPPLSVSAGSRGRCRPKSHSG